MTPPGGAGAWRGLGLAIARNIARGDGGDLVLESRADGHGLRAVLTLPR